MENPRLFRVVERLRVPLGVGSLALLFVVASSTLNPTKVVHASDDCTSRAPGAGDYCAPDQCGPCWEGEGDCDPGQCGSGLTCAEEGSVDRCRPVEDTCDVAPGGGNYCGQSLRGRSRYDEMTYKRTELGEQVAVALGMVIR